MTTKERILTLRVLEDLKRKPNYAKKIGIRTKVEAPNPYEKDFENSDANSRLLCYNIGNIDGVGELD